MKQILLLEIDSLGKKYLIYLTESKSFYAVIREHQPISYPMDYTTLYHDTLDEVLQSLDINISEEERNKINEVVEAYPNVIWEEDGLEFLFKVPSISEEDAKKIAERYLNSKTNITMPIHIHVTPEEGERVKELVDKALEKLVKHMNNKGGNLR